VEAVSSTAGGAECTFTAALEMDGVWKAVVLLSRRKRREISFMMLRFSFQLF
jgi:hypothetical protein